MFTPQSLDTSRLDRSSQLSRLMIGWRQRLRPSDCADLVHSGRARPNIYVSQEDMAYLTGVTVKWYGALERGNLHSKYSDDFLIRVAEALRLDEGEWRTLYFLVNRQGPPPRSAQPHKPKPTASLQAWFALLPFPAFVCDASWELVSANDATERWLDGLVREGNYVRWLLCHPAPRTQISDWEIVARRTLAQVTAQAASLPDVEAIKVVLRDVLDRSETVSRWWARKPEVWMHDDGSHWKIRLSGAPEPTVVEVISTNPLRDSHLRTYTVFPLAGHLPTGCLPPSTLPPEWPSPTGGDAPTR